MLALMLQYKSETESMGLTVQSKFEKKTRKSNFNSTLPSSLTPCLPPFVLLYVLNCTILFILYNTVIFHPLFLWNNILKVPVSSFCCKKRKQHWRSVPVSFCSLWVLFLLHNNVLFCWILASISLVWSRAKKLECVSPPVPLQRSSLLAQQVFCVLGLRPGGEIHFT